MEPLGPIQPMETILEVSEMSSRATSADHSRTTSADSHRTETQAIIDYLIANKITAYETLIKLIYENIIIDKIEIIAIG